MRTWLNPRLNYNRAGKLLRKLGGNDRPRALRYLARSLHTANHQYTVSVYKFPVTTQESRYTVDKEFF